MAYLKKHNKVLEEQITIFEEQIVNVAYLKKHIVALEMFCNSQVDKNKDKSVRNYIYIQAKFIGQDRLCRYSKDKTYTLMLQTMTNGFSIRNYVYNIYDNGYCEYSGIVAFIKNWSDISLLD